VSRRPNAALRPWQPGHPVDEAGEIPARAGQARDEAVAHRIGDGRKYDRDRPRLPLECGGRRSLVCRAAGNVDRMGRLARGEQGMTAFLLTDAHWRRIEAIWENS
jgi:hypothetical protein